MTRFLDKWKVALKCPNCEYEIELLNPAPNDIVKFLIKKVEKE